MQDELSYPSIQEQYLRQVGVRYMPPLRYKLNLLLFAATILTTLFTGMIMMVEFENINGMPNLSAVLRHLTSDPTFLLQKGIPYSFTILLILLSHEMGHFLACRYYGINATLPFFLPAPVITGTFGAFIRIKSPFPNRKSLFDVGIAGPLAGFFIALPFLYFGLKFSTHIPLAKVAAGTPHFGDPLIFKLFAHFMIPPGHDTYLHPIGFAAWFACLATALNLLPIAQLDGGHVSYALFGKRAYYITWIFFSGIIGLMIYGFLTSRMGGWQWFSYAILLLLLRRIAGFRHPPTLDDDAPVGLGRKIWGAIALIVFVLTFIPVTIYA